MMIFFRVFKKFAFFILVLSLVGFQVFGASGSASIYQEKLEVLYRLYKIRCDELEWSKTASVIDENQYNTAEVEKMSEEQLWNLSRVKVQPHYQKVVGRLRFFSDIPMTKTFADRLINAYEKGLGELKKEWRKMDKGAFQDAHINVQETWYDVYRYYNEAICLGEELGIPVSHHKILLDMAGMWSLLRLQ